MDTDLATKQDSGEHMDSGLQQQVQGMLHQESSEKWLSGGQPTQVHSLIQATLDGAIKETVSAVTQIPVSTFTYSGTSPAVSTASTGDGS